MSIAELPKSCDPPRRLSQSIPLPRRNPHDDPQRVGLTSLDDLDSLNFYCFGGRRDFRQGFRALLVGGTGDSAIDLAEQLKNTDAVVIYLDPNAEAIEFAQSLAKTRGIADRIEWIEAPLPDLAGLGLEGFDYVNCRVLHHLHDPAAGLKSLVSVLNPDGAMGLMLNGRYGRTGVDQLRGLMRIVNHDTADLQQQLANTRAVIDRLPATNWCKRAVDLFPIYDQLDDSEIGGLFLREPSRAYSLPEVCDLLEICGLRLVEHTRDQRALYEPEFAFPEGGLRAEIQKLPRLRQQAAAELYWGAVTRHTFWASRGVETIAPITDPEMVPFFSRFAQAHGIRESILATDGDEWSWTCRLQGQVDVSITFHVAPAARRFVELIDGKRTLAEIVETILAAYSPRPPVQEAWKVCRYVMEVLLRQDLLLLRHKSLE